MKRSIIISCSVFAFLLLLWEVLVSFSTNFLFVLPSPSSILSSLITHFPRLFHHAIVTLKEMLGGFGLAIAASFPLAWMMHRFRSSRAVLQPFFVVIQCLPMFALAPIMVIWFGWSYTAIVIPTALMIFFPLTLNIYQGLRATPKELLDFFQCNQATRFQTFYKLHLPSAIPHIFSGFRISSAIAGIGAIGGEWAGAQEGLGILMLESRRNTELEITFAALLLLTLMSFSLYALVILLEKAIAYPCHFNSTAKRIKRKSLYKKSFAFAFFLLILACTSCEKKEEPRRLLLDWLPNPNHVPLFVAQEKGFFKEEGISVQIQKMHESGGGIAYLTSHKADLLVGHMPSTMRAKARGASIKIIGLLIKEPLNCLIYLKEQGLSRPEELNGKRMGFSVGSPDTLFLDTLLSDKKITPSERLNVGTDLISAIATKRVDFIFGGYWNIEPAHIESLGLPCNYFKINEFGIPPYYELIILARGDDPTTNSDFALRFQRALDKSINYCRNNPKEAFACYLHLNPDKGPKTIAWEEKAWEKTLPLLANDQQVDEKEMAIFAQWVEKIWKFSRPIDTSSLIFH